MKKLLTVALLVFINFFKEKGYAGSDPSLEWHTIHTANFSVTYHQGGEKTARKVAAYAEEAYETLKNIFGIVPSEKTEIVIHDLFDVSNGFANNLPYNRIELFAAPPSVSDELAYFDDYLRLLVYHEYTHILHLEHVSGLPALINAICRKLILPNHAVPAWLTEGFATYIESVVSRRGRLASSLFEMYLRAAYMKNGFLTLEQLTDTPIDLPRGASPYLYGAFFMNFIFGKSGRDKFRDFIDDYSGKIIPYSLNTIAKRHFGKTFMELYEEFLASLREKYKQGSTIVLQKGISEGIRLTTGGEYKSYPVFTGGGTFAYVKSDGRDTAAIVSRKLKRDGSNEYGKEELLHHCYGGCSNLRADGKGELYFISGRYFRNYRFYNDLFKLDLNSKEVEKITSGKRIREFDLLPGGKVIYATCEFDRCSLNRLDIDSRISEEIFYHPEYEIISQPAASKDGKLIVFAAYRRGMWDLYLLESETGTLKRLTCSESIERDLIFAGNGKGILYSSDATGIFNLVYMEIEGVETEGVKTWELTNVPLGAFQPYISGDEGVIYSGYTPDGYEIFHLKGGLEEIISGMSASALIGDMCAGETVAPISVLKELPEPIAPQEYNPFESLKPRGIRPLFLLDSSGNVRAGFRLSGIDAVRHHMFVVKIDSELKSFNPFINLHYENKRYYPTLSANFTYYEGMRYTFLNDQHFFAETRNFAGSFSATLPFYGVKHNFQAAAGYFFDYSFEVNGDQVIYDPGSMTPVFLKTGFLSGPFISLNYNSTERFVYSISHEKGIFAGISFSYTPPSVISEFYTYQLLGNFDFYIPVFFLKQNVISVKSLFGSGFGEEGAERIFALGGFPPQNILASLINQEHLSSRYLRGYPAQAFFGNKFYLLNIEYRFPLFYLFRGLDTLPLFFKRIHGAFFLDAGDAFFDLPDTKYGAGAELRFDLTAMYQIPYFFKLGYARGFSELGGDFFYFILGL